MSVNTKCVLAYSGGLDTSAIVPWLIDQSYEVHAVLVDVGQNEDLPAVCEKALRFGAATAIIRDAKPAMYKSVVPLTIGLGATYEGTYRLGTALARPFIALEQIERARQLGGATLVHGATGKGNDQIRFEFAYRTLAPQYPVLAPWKVWDFQGRQDLVDFLRKKNLDENFEVTKDYSLDENLWHLSVEGGELEDPDACLDVQKVLSAVADRFGGDAVCEEGPESLTIAFDEGVPTAIDGTPTSLPELIGWLNRAYRHAPWAWDLVIENRFTGIKSRGLYINPAAKLLHFAVDALARTCLNKTVYDQYADLGRQYGTMLYRGEYFSQQSDMLETAGWSIMKHLTGSVTVQLSPAPYASRIDAPGGIFTQSASTFERSDFAHRDAEGFIHLSWLSSVGRPSSEDNHADVVEEKDATAPDVRPDQQLVGSGLVPAAT
ncbi:MAG: argininosuccinate synthase [Planctomycetes bacterium]|nr:argininosuccinate synthase [Planctomycetota bacterium]